MDDESKQAEEDKAVLGSAERLFNFDELDEQDPVEIIADELHLLHPSQNEHVLGGEFNN
jgi:hypothetical protein